MKGLVTPQAPNQMVNAMYDAPRVAIRRASNQSIATGTDTQIDFLSGATVEFDSHGMFSTSASTYLSCVRAGIYLVNACVNWESESSGNRFVWIKIGSTTKQRVGDDAIAGNLQQSVTTIVELAVGDTIEMWVRQSQGDSSNVLTTNGYSPRLTAIWLAPEV